MPGGEFQLFKDYHIPEKVIFDYLICVNFNSSYNFHLAESHFVILSLKQSPVLLFPLLYYKIIFQITLSTAITYSVLSFLSTEESSHFLVWIWKFSGPVKSYKEEPNKDQLNGFSRIYVVGWLAFVFNCSKYIFQDF